MTLALKLGIEEWEEFAHMEISKKVMEGTIRARCRGEKSFVQRMVSSLPGQGAQGGGYVVICNICFLIFTAIVIFRCGIIPTFNR